MCQNSNTPLDQINRDWSKGNCRFATLEFMKNFSEDKFGTLPVKLVHGTISTGSHAWIKIGNMVWDNANNNAIFWEKGTFEIKYSAKASKEFTRQQADAILQDERQDDGSFKNLDWANYTDDHIASCVEKYDSKSSPFNIGIWFSNPIAPANRDNLQLNQ